MIKIIGIALICSIIIFYLKNINSELTILVEIMSGIILLSCVIPYILDVFNFFNEIIELSSIDKNIYKILFKIIAIGYLLEFSAGTIEDFGLKGLSSKLILIGKIIIISMSLPIIYGVINILKGLLI